MAVFIENDGALFRGPARGVPQEVWNGSEFVPYRGAGQPRDVSWGTVIDEAEAQRMMGQGQQQPAQAPAAPQQGQQGQA